MKPYNTTDLVARYSAEGLESCLSVIQAWFNNLILPDVEGVQVAKINKAGFAFNKDSGVLTLAAMNDPQLSTHLAELSAQLATQSDEVAAHAADTTLHGDIAALSDEVVVLSAQLATQSDEIAAHAADTTLHGNIAALQVTTGLRRDTAEYIASGVITADHVAKLPPATRTICGVWHIPADATPPYALWQVVTPQGWTVCEGGVHINQYDGRLRLYYVTNGRETLDDRSYSGSEITIGQAHNLAWFISPGSVYFGLDGVTTGTQGVIMPHTIWAGDSFRITSPVGGLCQWIGIAAHYLLDSSTYRPPPSDDPTSAPWTALWRSRQSDGATLSDSIVPPLHLTIPAGVTRV